MGKKSWRETFGTIGLNSEVFTDQNFENLTYDHTSKEPNPDFDQERVFRLDNRLLHALLLKCSDGK